MLALTDFSSGRYLNNMTDYNKYTDEQFKNAQEFEKFLHSGKILKYDHVIVGGILYTMHEYDNDGREVTWANKKHNSMMSVTTSNRYGYMGYTDAKVEVYEPGYLRDDIIYAE